MKSVNIRRLRHDTAALLEQVESGESVEIRRRDRPVAVLCPPARAIPARPDFRGRLAAAYGAARLGEAATEAISRERGDR